MNKLEKIVVTGVVAATAAVFGIGGYYLSRPSKGAQEMQMNMPDCHQNRYEQSLGVSDRQMNMRGMEGMDMPGMNSDMKTKSSYCGGCNQGVSDRQMNMQGMEGMDMPGMNSCMKTKSSYCSGCCNQ